MESTRDDAAKFDAYDVVRVRGQSHLVGTVSFTYDHIGYYERLEDLLILLHTDVPNNIVSEFRESGILPWGYVFVNFITPCHGSALIHEGDLELVDRFLDVGQSVKRHFQSHLGGTVISSSAKCVLKPIAYQPLNPRTGDYGQLKFSEKPNGRAVWPSDADPSDDDGPTELHDVPMSELTDHDPYCEDSYIIYRQKVGRVRSIERDAVLLLPNQKLTSLHDYNSIGRFILDDSKDPVSVPDCLDQIHVHSLPDGRQIWSSDAEPIVPGQYAITSASNMNRNDLKSDRGPDVEPEGYILATPATSYTIDWICPNVFAVGVSYNSPTTQRCGAALIHEHAVKCDFGQLPQDAHSNQKPARADLCLQLGGSVRFRDPTHAMQKYPQYRHIPTDESFGYDLNILQIVSTKTEVTVKWQDGSITTEESVCLCAFDHAEEELWPGKLVALKEATEIRREPYFNVSMNAEFMVDHYRLRKVGVVQTVDSRERIASVRWYESPDIELAHEGKMMQPGSTLGALGSDVTDVSFYEITTYSFINLYVGAMVLIVPHTVHEATLPPPDLKPKSRYVGPCLMSSITPVTFFETFAYLAKMREYLVLMEWFKKSITIDRSAVPSRFSLHYSDFNANTPADFFGRVISMDTDGTFTVRIASANNCHDVRVTLEWLMLVVDRTTSLPPSETSIPEVMTLRPNNMLYAPAEDSDNPPANQLDRNEREYDSSTELDTEAAVARAPGNSEYSDQDSTDSESENNDDIHDFGNDHFEAPVVSEIMPPEDAEVFESEDLSDMESSEAKPFTDLSSPSTECPAAFALLEGPPPSDHHFLASEQNGFSGKLLKRIHKEYEILRSSLPPGIVVRAWESRVDLFRVLIIGPQGTPYEYAPFVFDFGFTNDFPNTAPRSFFHSWTNNTGRINPNLYENGTVCLSILGTWTAKNPDETWSPTKSTVLQILVSIMGLVLVTAPFYNEAGYETLADQNTKSLESSQYSEKAFMMTRKFIQHALQHPVAGMEDVLSWHYLPASTPQEGDSERPQLLRRAIDQALEMIEHHNRTNAGDELKASAFIPRLSLGAVVILRKHVTSLEGIESAKSAQAGC